MPNKIVRTICFFAANPSDDSTRRLNDIEGVLKSNGFEVQTKRICSTGKTIKELDEAMKDTSVLLNVGTLSLENAQNQLKDFFEERSVSFNLDLTAEEIAEKHIELLFDIIKENPAKTFEFAYVFNNAPSSPYFPSAVYEKEGFSIGLQSTALAKDCKTLEEWLNNMKIVWEEIDALFKEEKDYLGIDSSIAPIFDGDGSLINFVKKIKSNFEESVLTDIYLTITEFIKKQNPKPVGLCGLMFPCLEDFELADEYEKGNFSIERNIFLSLHSGLGIDTYPVGIDENPAKITDILKVVQRLSSKYKKPLSVRFVSDGNAKIGEKTDFQNQYLKDVTIRKL
ncbi:MAG: DUF711 family protein [Candidatus Moranbacteria bacterium]|nr:DUF711 family protein [Candidatus Moranbacteria bacterium]